MIFDDCRLCKMRKYTSMSTYNTKGSCGCMKCFSLTSNNLLNPTPQKQVQRKRDVFCVRLGHLETKNFMLCMQLASLTRKRRRSVNET